MRNTPENVSEKIFYSAKPTENMAVSKNSMIRKFLALLTGILAIFIYGLPSLAADNANVPDLVTNLELNKAGYSQGEPIKFTLTVSNNGASAPPEAKLRIDMDITSYDGYGRLYLTELETPDDAEFNNPPGSSPYITTTAPKHGETVTVRGSLHVETRNGKITATANTANIYYESGVYDDYVEDANPITNSSSVGFSVIDQFVDVRADIVDFPKEVTNNVPFTVTVDYSNSADSRISFLVNDFETGVGIAKKEGSLNRYVLHKLVSKTFRDAVTGKEITGDLYLEPGQTVRATYSVLPVEICSSSPTSSSSVDTQPATDQPTEEHANSDTDAEISNNEYVIHAQIRGFSEDSNPDNNFDEQSVGFVKPFCPMIDPYVIHAETVKWGNRAPNGAWTPKAGSEFEEVFEVGLSSDSQASANFNPSVYFSAISGSDGSHKTPYIGDAFDDYRIEFENINYSNFDSMMEDYNSPDNDHSRINVKNIHPGEKFRIKVKGRIKELAYTRCAQSYTYTFSGEIKNFYGSVQIINDPDHPDSSAYYQELNSKKDNNKSAVTSPAVPNNQYAGPQACHQTYDVSVRVNWYNDPELTEPASILEPGKTYYRKLTAQMYSNNGVVVPNIRLSAYSPEISGQRDLVFGDSPYQLEEIETTATFGGNPVEVVRKPSYNNYHFYEIPDHEFRDGDKVEIISAMRVEDYSHDIGFGMTEGGVRMKTEYINSGTRYYSSVVKWSGDSVPGIPESHSENNSAGYNLSPVRGDKPINTILTLVKIDNENSTPFQQIYDVTFENQSNTDMYLFNGYIETYVESGYAKISITCPESDTKEYCLKILVRGEKYYDEYEDATSNRTSFENKDLNSLTIPAHKKIHFLVTVTSNIPTTSSVYARASAYTFNNSNSRDASELEPQPYIGVRKHVDKPRVNPGEPVNFSVDVFNVSAEDIEDLVLKDPMSDLFKEATPQGFANLTCRQMTNTEINLASPAEEQATCPTFNVTTDGIVSTPFNLPIGTGIHLEYAATAPEEKTSIPNIVYVYKTANNLPTSQAQDSHVNVFVWPTFNTPVVPVTPGRPVPPSEKPTPEPPPTGSTPETPTTPNPGVPSVPTNTVPNVPNIPTPNGNTPGLPSSSPKPHLPNTGTQSTIPLAVFATSIFALGAILSARKYKMR